MRLSITGGKTLRNRVRNGLIAVVWIEREGPKRSEWEVTQERQPCEDVTMSVRIHYCSLCGFAEHAEAIAQAVSAELGLATDLQEAVWGTFRVEWSGQEIYNRWRTRGILGRLGMGRTPTPEEIVLLLTDVTGSQPVQSAADGT